MPWHLSFSTLAEYDPGQPGITVPVILRLPRCEAPCLAKIDTGSSDCIFRRFQGELLGLDMKTETRAISVPRPGHSGLTDTQSR